MKFIFFVGISLSKLRLYGILLLLLVFFIAFNFYKPQINICSNCGAISLGLNTHCTSCGTDLKNNNKVNKLDKKPSESTIEVKAEEIQ